MTNGVQIDPGTGYRLIDKALDKPQDGDEYYSIFEVPNGWHPRLHKDQWLYNYEYRRKIDAGDGYRLIDPAVDKPESGDEVLHPVTGQFVPRCEWKGYPFSTTHTYRRKYVPLIDPGEGYRLIDPTTDKPQKGDEFWWPLGGKWSPRQCPGCGFHPDDIYRRKVEQPATAVTLTFGVAIPPSSERVTWVFRDINPPAFDALFTHPDTQPPVTPAAPTIDPGEGYRLIDTTKDKPQEGDEFLSPSTRSWEKRAASSHWIVGNTYRRKIQTVHVYAQATLDDWMDMDDPHDGVDTVGPVRKLHEIGKIEGGTVFVLYDNE